MWQLLDGKLTVQITASTYAAPAIQSILMNGRHSLKSRFLMTTSPSRESNAARTHEAMAELSLRLAGLHWHGLVLVLRLVQLPPSLFQVCSVLNLEPQPQTLDRKSRCS